LEPQRGGTKGMKMYTYDFFTDATQESIKAQSMLEAAQQFARTERLGEIETIEELIDAVEEIGDGAWISIRTDDGPETWVSSDLTARM
jgi:hypothetical protein